MSLISDALKKARQDVARQDAQRQRLPYAVGAADSPRRRFPLLPLLAGLGGGGLMAALLLAAAWSAGWGPFGAAAKETVRTAEAAPPPAPPPVTRAVEPAAAIPAEQPEPTPAAPPQAAAPAPASPVREDPPPAVAVRPAEPAAPPEVRPPAPETVEEEAPAPAAVPAPARPSPAPQGAGGLVDGQTYTGEVPLPGGGAVKLNGIAYSPERPIAVLDGRVMAPGESIQGFTLVAVEAGRVKLQGFGATVFVSPK